MADIKLNRKHQLGLKAAHAAADKMAEKLGQQFGLSGSWEGNTLHFSRPGVSGHMHISEADVTLEVTLGFLLKAMKGPIERAVNEQLDAALSAAPKTKTTSKAPEKKAPGERKKSL